MIRQFYNGSRLVIAKNKVFVSDKTSFLGNIATPKNVIKAYETGTIEGEFEPLTLLSNEVITKLHSAEIGEEVNLWPHLPVNVRVDIVKRIF